MEELKDSLKNLDYKTFLIVTNLEGVRQLKNKCCKEQKYKDAAKLRELEKFIGSDEYEKMSLSKKHEEREKKLQRIIKK
jgi:hypothetical protein